MTVLLLIIHIICLFIAIVAGIYTKKNGYKVLYTIFAMFWGIWSVLDIVKLYIFIL